MHITQTDAGAEQFSSQPHIVGFDFAALEWSGLADAHQTAHPGRGVHYAIVGTVGPAPFWEVTVWDGASSGQRIACFPSEGGIQAMLTKAKGIANEDWQRRAQSLPPTFQHRVYEWVISCFGHDIARDMIERNHRFLEEALELVQSVGCSRSEAHQLVDYVYGRPAGDPFQEAGGTLVTLAALLRAADLVMDEAGEIELTRVWLKADAIRAKQAAKPKHSPLPEGSGILDASRMPAPDTLVGYHGGQVMPAMFHFALEDHDLLRIASECGFHAHFVDLLGNLPTDDENEALEAAYESDPSKVLSEWEPTVPEGWQFGGKWHGEESPVACFLRKQEVAP